jgi:polysaccharide export outer membrane protein
MTTSLLLLKPTIKQNPHQTAFDFWHLFQRFIALFFIILFAPIFIVLYILVKKSSKGPFIYKQARPGLNGKSINIVKIRTMKPGADHNKKNALAVQSDNPDITKIGKILRDLKLDELPQLWNVIRGDMALVGPRPIAPELHQLLQKNIPDFHLRSTVRPGLTNLGQVCILDNSSQEEIISDWTVRFEAEKHYIENKSLYYDSIIILMTMCFLAKKALRKFFRSKSRNTILLVLPLVIFLTNCSSIDKKDFTQQGNFLVKEIPASIELNGNATVEEIPVTISTQNAKSYEKDYRIGAGDILNINVFEEPGLSNLQVRIDGEGCIQLPMVERIPVEGKTLSELQTELKNAYSSAFQKPWVTVEIVTYRSHPVYLLGQFNNPGIVYMEGPTNILQALAHGKGFSEMAYLRGACVIRDKQIQPIDIYQILNKGNIEHNIWLTPHDTIYVPDIREQSIFIFGQIEQPGMLSIPNQSLTLMQAVSRSGGLITGTAKTDEIRIIRSESVTQGKMMLVDLGRIFKGDAPDVKLMAGDIIFIPQNTLADWNEFINAINPTLTMVSNSLTPFVQVKFLAKN